jgi:hypothetical protein
MSRSLVLRSALMQTVLVGALSALLAVVLGAHFFTHWGWLVGPIAWLACSLATARALSLPVRRTLLGAILAGLPSIAAVAVGLHWLGDIVAIVLFGLWCGSSTTRGRAAWGV